MIDPHRRISPRYPSSAAIAFVHGHIIKFVQILQYFHTIINLHINLNTLEAAVDGQQPIEYNAPW